MTLIHINHTLVPSVSWLTAASVVTLPYIIGAVAPIITKLLAMTGL